MSKSNAAVAPRATAPGFPNTRTGRAVMRIICEGGVHQELEGGEKRGEEGKGKTRPRSVRQVSLGGGSPSCSWDQHLSTNRDSHPSPLFRAPIRLPQMQCITGKGREALDIILKTRTDTALEVSRASHICNLRLQQPSKQISCRGGTNTIPSIPEVWRPCRKPTAQEAVSTETPDRTI